MPQPEHPFDLFWMEDNPTILILKSPANPNWQDVAEGWGRAFDTVREVTDEVGLIFDVTLSPDPPDPRIITKLSALLSRYPNNLRTMVIYGSNEKNKSALRILSKTLVPILQVADTLAESIEIIESRRVAVR